MAAVVAMLKCFEGWLWERERGRRRERGETVLSVKNVDGR
jgi:hypothetical protein